VNLGNRTPKAERAGILLIDCLVYITVLILLLGLGFAAFYSCWEKSKSLRYHAADISRALRAGERWRADIRRAAGPITVSSGPDGQWLEIPRGTNTVVYVFTAGQVLRQSGAGTPWVPVLPRVRASTMVAERRTRVTAWRWDVELLPTRPQVRVPPVFSFQAVPAVGP